MLQCFYAVFCYLALLLNAMLHDKVLLTTVLFSSENTVENIRFSSKSVGFFSLTLSYI